MDELNAGALQTLEVFIEAERSFARAKVHFMADIIGGWIVIDSITTEDGVLRKIDPPVVVSTLTP